MDELVIKLEQHSAYLNGAEVVLPQWRIFVLLPDHMGRLNWVHVGFVGTVKGPINFIVSLSRKYNVLEWDVVEEVNSILSEDPDSVENPRSFAVR